tara:strand:+ start:399 stop:656 length:258 start_codon:yes stop_codon:yes gene_type:complete
MAVLHDGATYIEFVDYVTTRRGELPENELEDLWSWHCKLQSLTFDTKKGWKALALADDEKHLTNREREQKVVAEAKAQGRNIERV